MRITAKSGDRTYEITGSVLSMIPLRNRRKTPEGEQLVTRISEGMTEWQWDGRSGYGLSEYLDQIVDGAPVGASDLTSDSRRREPAAPGSARSWPARHPRRRPPRRNLPRAISVESSRSRPAPAVRWRVARELVVRRGGRAADAARARAAARPGLDRRAVRALDRVPAARSRGGARACRCPTVRFLLDPDDDIGDGFVMDRIEGETIPRRILRDDEYAACPPTCSPRQCGAIAAQIHAVDLDGAARARRAGSARADRAVPRRSSTALGEPHPAFELGLRWLEDHVALTGLDAAPRLVHGDFRNGNFIVGPEGIRSVLDWELSHLGDPVEDLGWLCVKSWRFGLLDQPVGGFGSTDALLDAYARGRRRRRVDPEHLHYWETFGTLEVGRDLRDAVLQPPPRPRALGRARGARAPDRGDRVGPAGADRMTLHDRPTAAELVAAVHEYLERDVMTATEGRVAFHARVAVNVLGHGRARARARRQPRTPRSTTGSSSSSAATARSGS